MCPQLCTSSSRRDPPIAAHSPAAAPLAGHHGAWRPTAAPGARRERGAAAVLQWWAFTNHHLITSVLILLYIITGNTLWTSNHEADFFLSSKWASLMANGSFQKVNEVLVVLWFLQMIQKWVAFRSLNCLFKWSLWSLKIAWRRRLSEEVQMFLVEVLQILDEDLPVLERPRRGGLH